MRILIAANNDVGLYKFRKELIQRLLKEHDVHISLPYGNYIDDLVAMGCTYWPCEFDRHGTNPIKELAQIASYTQLIRNCRPDAVLTYTIKPNVYAGIACAMLKIPYIANITGLGGAVKNGGLMQTVSLTLYRLGLRRASKVFFQNEENQQFMLKHGVGTRSHDLLPGSGVNLEQHAFEPYPEDDKKITLLVIGRIMRDKGSDEVFQAAKIIKQRYPNVVFRLLGFCDGDYQEKLDVAAEDGSIEYLGMQKDVHSFIKDSHATVHASYHEGMANVLLETAACGRPVIATDIPGCRETFDDGVSGFSCKARDVDSLVATITKFIELSHDSKVKMGLAGRKKMEREFDRSIVVEKYIQELNKIKETRR